MIQPLGFIDTAAFSSWFHVKHREKMTDGILNLRTIKPDDVDYSETPLVREWKSARAILLRIRNRAAETLKGPTDLGKAFIETLPPHTGSPWTREDQDYAAQYARLRICLFSAPGCWTFSGMTQAQLSVGVVNLVENRQLCSELNLSDHPRTHLVVDVRRSDEQA